MNPTLRRTVIIGGGLSGLAAARDLALAGQHVTVLESAPVAGGLASSLRLKGESVEHFYHFICRGDHASSRWSTSWASAPTSIWRHTRTSFFHEGRLYGFGTPMELLRFSPVPVMQRLRFGWHVTRS